MELKSLEFVELNYGLKDKFLEMAKDYQSAGEDRFKSGIEDFRKYLEYLENHRKTQNMPDGNVGFNTFFLSIGGKLVGSGSLRHELNETLAIYGGHIGYAVRPSERKKGYGSLILHLTLEKAREFGFQRVFVTCDTDNLASVKIIEKNGGRLEDRIFYELIGKSISQYWIELF